MCGREPVDHLVALAALKAWRRRGGVHAAGEDELIHACPNAGRCTLHGGLARGAVPVDREARHRGETRGDRRMSRDDTAAVEALAQDHVVDRG
jgi:hypothetical protein